MTKEPENQGKGSAAEPDNDKDWIDCGWGMWLGPAEDRVVNTSLEMQLKEARAENARLQRHAKSMIDALNADIDAKANEIGQLKAAIAEYNYTSTAKSAEIERLKAAIAWTREVRPGKNPESGGAIVYMTWDQFNMMRKLADKPGPVKNRNRA